MYVGSHLMAAWLVHVALSPLVLAVLAGMTALDGLRGKCGCRLRRVAGALHGTWHDVHDAVRHVRLARPAYAALSAVSAAVCARSSAMPAGSLSDVLGDSTAAPTGEIVPKWEWLWLRENRQVGTGEREWGNVGTGGSGTDASAGMDLSGIEALVGFHPCPRESVPALGSSDVRVPRARKSTPSVRC